MRITAFARTDVGRHREINEDNEFHGATVFAVADGMGGHVAGEIASERALESIRELDGKNFDDPRAATDALRVAIEEANRAVVAEAEEKPDLAGMGTTLTAVMVRDGSMHIAHVGDSRAYLLRGGEQIDQLTTDHTLVEQLVQDGRLSRDEIANHPQRSVITRAIGVEPEVEVDTLAPLVLQPGDQILLCSDGLTGPVSDEQITNLLLSEPDGDMVVDRLIQAANDGGGPDNITVVLLRVEGDGTMPPRVAAGDLDNDNDTNPNLSVAPGDATRSIPIRTRPASENHDWARDMSRYGDRQGVDGPAGKDQRRGGRRALAIITGFLVIVAILIAGGYLLLSRAYFIGDAGGNVGIFNGLPQDVAGFELYRQLSDTGLPMSALPAFQQERIREGIAVGSRAAAERIVAGYRAELEDNASGNSDPRPDPTPS